MCNVAQLTEQLLQFLGGGGGGHVRHLHVTAHHRCCCCLAGLGGRSLHSAAGGHQRLLAAVLVAAAAGVVRSACRSGCRCAGSYAFELGEGSSDAASQVERLNCAASQSG